MTENNNEDFNTDELEAPAWLNTKLFSKILRKYKNDDEIVVAHVNFTPASAKGDHYASVMFRASVNYKQQGKELNQSLIIKTMPELDGPKKDMLQDSFIFETEIGMYAEVLPKFEKLLRSVGDKTVLAANCVYHSLSPHKFIIFEDLVPLGYTVIRDRSFSIDEVKLAYLKISKIHALSYKLCLEQPEIFESYRHSVMATDDFVKNDFVQDGIHCFVEMLNTRPDLQEYKSYFEPLQANLINKVVASSKEYRDNPQPQVPYVLCHGDFHGKNFMVKINEEDNKADDLMLLDYQFCYVGSIANDLLYSFYLLLDAEQRAYHLDELIEYYFENFLTTLQKVGFAGRLPKLSDLREELRRQKHYEIFLLTSFLPLWLAMRDKNTDRDEIMFSTEYRKQFYYQQDYIDELKIILPKLLQK